MPRFQAEPSYRHGTARRIGVLLTNLGTPDAPHARALRTYLKEFLWDPRIVEIPRPVWWLILNGIILNTRPKKSAAKYASIWSAQGSPLRAWTHAQAQALSETLNSEGQAPVILEVGMRYGNPSIDSALKKLREAHCDRILVAPLYPQYASSTTASTLDAVGQAFRSVRNVPALRFIRHFHDDPGYIHALAMNVSGHWATHGRPEKLIMSFHGVPQYTLDRGDPYHCECLKTGRLLAEALALRPEEWMVTFQSLFGRAEWIKPYTEPTVRALARNGVKRIDVVCPGFPADCLETLEEIGMEVKDAFLSEGGETFHYIPALNTTPHWIKGLTSIIERELQGWRQQTWSPERERALLDIEAREARAKACPF